jgi:hypothetical protein
MILHQSYGVFGVGVGDMPFGRGSHKKEKNYWILHHDFESCHTCLMQQLSV